MFSALAPTTDIAQEGRHVRFVPGTDSCTAANYVAILVGSSIGISPAGSPLTAFLISRADWRHMSCTLGPYEISSPASTSSLKLNTVAMRLRAAMSTNSTGEHRNRRRRLRR